jgi:peptide/nickel transport system ATP-binding protein
MLLRLKDLRVTLSLGAGSVRAVRGIDLEVDRGETLCVVGESGSGKSMTALAIMNLLPSSARRSAELMEFNGRNLLEQSERETERLRGNELSMVFQEPMTSLNPAYTIGDQLMEVHVRHKRSGRAAARARAKYLLERVGIPNGEARLRQYPHQLSGGLRQRVMIAMALMCGPALVIADEPTSALDVTIQAQILRLFKDLQREFAMALILITHDLGVVARVADRVAVMYAGQVVESGPVRDIFRRPRHPYTQGLLACVPSPGRVLEGGRLAVIPGTVPSLLEEISGCAFSGRCPEEQSDCVRETVPMFGSDGAHQWRCLHSQAAKALQYRVRP